jgi:osmoprotectant transport system permease protein
MTVADRTAAEAAPDRPPAPGPPAARRRLPGALVVTPVLVAAGLVAVVLWAGSRGLDDIEARTINPAAIGQALGEHLLLTGVSTLLVIALAVPLGIALSRPRARRVRPAVLALGGFLQALPAFGVIVLLAFTPLGLGAPSAIVALVVASFLPVVTNTVVGLAQVDPAMVEAARGVGMSAGQTLRRVELPLAVPVLVAGVRVALVLNVGSATLATYIGAGGLGAIIDGNLRLGRPTATVVAAAIVAALALLVDWLAGLAEHLVRRSV